MQKVVTCLTFNDQAEQALEFYRTVLRNSKILFSKYMGEGADKKFLTGFLEFDGQQIMVLNGGPQFSFTMGFSLMINCRDQEEIDYYWEKLAEGGKTDSCGWLRDKFGVSWQIVPDNIATLMFNPDREVANRVLNAVWGMTKIVIADLKA